MEVNLINEALKFMMLGMGVVFTFLVIMIVLLKIQGNVLPKLFPEKKENPVQKKPMSNKGSTNQAAKVAAISAAIQHHNNVKG
jgi:oxaloacetate decarboxylase gamma subunit